jgi:hypothetical protein
MILCLGCCYHFLVWALLWLTFSPGSEVAVLEGAMHQLQAELASKRREAYELEDQLSLHNPSVFATVQVNAQKAREGQPVHSVR